jgi:hypothetical protein
MQRNADSERSIAFLLKAQGGAPRVCAECSCFGSNTPSEKRNAGGFVFESIGWDNLDPSEISASHGAARVSN